MGKRSFPLIAGAIVLTLAAAGCAPGGPGPAGQLPQEVKIGVIFPLSGSQAKLGQESYNGAEIAKDMVNRAGGVLGRQVVFVKADIPDATAAVNETNRLITQEKVPVIFGAYVSTLSLAASEVTERNRVVFVEEAAVATEITGRGFKYVLRTNANSDQYGATAANFAAQVLAPKLGAQAKDLRVAIVHEDSSYGQSVGRAANDTAKQLGMQVVAKESYSQTTTDLTPLVLRVKDARPDVIIATSYLNDAILFWKQAREQQLGVKALIGTGAGHSNVDFAKARGADAEGVLNVSNPFEIKTDGLTEEARQQQQEFRKLYREKFGVDAGLQAHLSFFGAWTLLHYVMPKAGRLDPDAIMQVAKALDVPEGTSITSWGVKFDDTGQNVRAFPVVMQWQGGSLQTVHPSKLALVELKGVPFTGWK